MPRKFLALLPAVLALCHAQAPKPTFYTMVREDTFAGYIGGDMARFERGMKYTDQVLADNPQNADALVWKGGGQVFLATRLYAQDLNAKADILYEGGLALMEQALANAPGNAGVQASYGGVLAYLAPRLPEGLRRKAALEKARAMYERLYKAQEQVLDRMPVHFRGETLAGLAETNLKLGNMEQARVYLKRISATLPNTSYAKTAELWLAHPESVDANEQIVCGTCHEAGRLRH
jgi:tetratricopeptide (TPR) repeat protein